MASSRGKNYSTNELKHLCHSVLHISQDPCVGAGQRNIAFWDRVTEHYEKSKPKGCSFRGRKSLEGKWSEVKHDVAKFDGCYQQVDDLQISGNNLEDTVVKAKELYKQNNPKGKPFMFEECWGILKDFPRFGNPADDMVKGKSKRASPAEADKENAVPNQTVLNQADADQSSVAEMVDLTDSDSEGHRKRPSGTKKAKDQAKRQKHNEDALRMSAHAQKEMAAAGRDKVKVMQDNSLMQLLSMPTDTMEPELRSFMMEWKLEEAKKLRERMRGYSAPSPQPPIEQSPPIQPPIEPRDAVSEDYREDVPTGPPTAHRTAFQLFSDDIDTTLQPDRDLAFSPLGGGEAGVYGYGIGDGGDM